MRGVERQTTTIRILLPVGSKLPTPAGFHQANAKLDENESQRFDSSHRFFLWMNAAES